MSSLYHSGTLAAHERSHLLSARPRLKARRWAAVHQRSWSYEVDYALPRCGVVAYRRSGLSLGDVSRSEPPDAHEEGVFTDDLAP